MSMTISNNPGDNSFQANIELLDSGTTVYVTGCIWPSSVGGNGNSTTTSFTGSPLTSPAVPVSGSIFWIIEVNMATAALLVLQSTVAMPVADPGCEVIFSQTLVPGQVDPATVPTDATPDV